MSEFNCKVCDQELMEGYIVDNVEGSEYYCEKHKPSNYNELYDDEIAYWSEF